MGKPPSTETLWTILQPDGQVLGCLLHNDNDERFEVILLLDLKRVAEQRFLSHAAAMIEADESRRRALASVGGTLIFERRTPPRQRPI
jgi:hypothetical protein